MAPVLTRPVEETRLGPAPRPLPQLPVELTASKNLDRRQSRFLLNTGLIVLLVLAIWPLPTLIVLMFLTTVIYLSIVAHRLYVTRESLRAGNVIRVSDARARAIPDDELPVYTVLEPAYRESEVMHKLLGNLRALEYPSHKLDVKLLLEGDDDETIEAAMRDAVGGTIEIVLVPPGDPRTKPKALNYGLTVARGEFVTIYDAEDQPDPLQLRRAVYAFQHLPPDIVCLQAELTFDNTDQNLLTRWFTTEYLMWFTLFLPGLASTDAPVPLGGTSNHMRRDALEAIGAWDAYNVTEDADLGIRLHRLGGRTGVLESVTYEEANSDFVNWMKQRSRWYKGYLQTWLVHLRHPVDLYRELGPSGFLQYLLFVGGTPLLALLNPLFWFMALAWFVAHAGVIQEIFPAPLYHMALFAWVIGNFTILYVTILAARRSGRPSLVWAACLVPVYWVMMSMAAIKAFWQMIAAPSFWEKTTHGLSGSPAPAGNGAGSHGGPGNGTEGNGHDGNGDAPERRSAAARVVTLEAAAASNWGEIAPSLPTLEMSQGRWAEPDTANRGALRLARIGRRLQVAGLIAVLFVAYAVVWTGWRADRSQAQLREELAHTTSVHVPAEGHALARLQVKSAGIDSIVVEGASRSDLHHGPGHVIGTAYPGSKRNAVIVGTRVTWSGPFRHLGDVSPGDPIDITGPWGHARYRVVASSNRSASGVDLTLGHKGRLTLVTSDGGTGSGRRVVEAKLTSRVLRRSPRPAHAFAQLPGSDSLALALLLVWSFVGVLAWRSRRWLVQRWGRLGGALLVLPLVAFAFAEAFGALLRVLPATF
jgi:LPXTG-site transpeptidase (sortase) family protein